MLADYDKYRYDYKTYWENRKYEDQAERIALRNLLSGHHFKRFIDIGGSFGRLTDEYYSHADQVVIVDYSLETLRRNSKELQERFPGVILIAADAYNLPFEQNSFDGGLMVRVLHHLDRAEEYVKELQRVIAPGGHFIQEYANKIHLKNRLKALLGKDIDLSPETPYQQPSHGAQEGAKGEEVPFLNYHPEYIEKLFAKYDFEIEKSVPVSFLRSTPLRKLPLPITKAVEATLQVAATTTSATPSIFTKVVSRESVKSPLDLGNPYAALICTNCHSSLKLQRHPAMGFTCPSCSKAYSTHDSIIDFR